METNMTSEVPACASWRAERAQLRVKEKIGAKEIFQASIQRFCDLITAEA